MASHSCARKQLPFTCWAKTQPVKGCKGACRQTGISVTKSQVPAEEQVKTGASGVGEQDWEKQVEFGFAETATEQTAERTV